MSDLKQHPEESQLTAYVLDELDEARQREITAHLVECDSCRSEVEQCRQMSTALFEALQSEPVPALSDNQREAIRQAAAQPAPQRLVRVPEPATSGRRGILPLLTATIACAALLVGVSAWNFAPAPAQTMAVIDDSQQPSNLDAFYDSMDGLAITDESSAEALRRLSRLDVLTSEADLNDGLQKKLGESSHDSKELRQIVVQDGETPNVEMTIEQAQEAQVQLENARPQLTAGQLQGLAGTTTRPAVPGNMGNVADHAVDFLHRSFSGRDGSAPPTDKPVSDPVGSPSNGNQPGGSQANDAGGYGGPIPPRESSSAIVESEKLYDHRQTQLGRQSRGGESPQGAPVDHYFRFDKATTTQSMPQLQTPQQTGEQFQSRPVANPVPPATEPAPAGTAGKPAYAKGVTNTPLGTLNYYESAAEYGETPHDPYGRGEALQENLAEIPRQSGVQDRNQNGVWLDLDFDTAGLVNGTQFVPKFAVSELQRLAERESTRGISGLAAGTPENLKDGAEISSNRLTFTDEMLLGALVRNESEARGLQEQASSGTPLSRLSVWENGRWYAFTAEGRRLAVNVPGSEAYAPIVENTFLSPSEQPLSTFGLDVDTASYANVRRFLMEQRRFPPPDAVRIEEMVNYFAYSDPQPAGGEPVGVSLEAAVCPWNTEHRLVRIGLKAREIDLAERPPTTLVFLVDTSGSMRDDNKLPLVKNSLRILVDEMTENDRIAIVTYNNDAGLLLDSTSGQQRGRIMAAIDGLEANGSTNGEAGLKLAYEIATQHFIQSGQNRVILCTDGDFNVGTSDTDPLVKMISEKRDTGVFLSICGYGSGNIKDEKLERIADTGNGQYHYVDNLKEARKVFLDELSGMLYTVAKDVKLQVEFNPAHVGSYRLLGYENRKLAAKDFNNDRVDSGDMGAGHSVSALYEVVPVGVRKADPPGEQAPEAPKVDPLKYQPAESRERSAQSVDSAESTDAEPSTLNPQPSTSAEWLTVKLRYKQPDGQTSVKREFPLVVDPGGNDPSSIDLQWSAAVVSFGMLLRSSRHAGDSSLENVLELAQGAKGPDESGRRREFIDMVLQTRSLVRGLHGTPTPTPRELSSTEARQKATVGGKYEDLLDKFEVRDDVDRYGEFHDYGWSEDKTHASREGLPAGYWVYVYPDWYIWGENVSVRE